MPRRTSEPIQIYQLRVTLRGSHPPIWRQIQVRSDITLGKLHRILQAVMGWTGTHLHQFTIRGKQYWIPDEGDMDLRKKIDERKHRLRDVVSMRYRPTIDSDFSVLVVLHREGRIDIQIPRIRFDLRGVARASSPP